MATTCFDYDGDTLAGEETLPQQSGGGGGGQPGAQRNSSRPRGGPARRTGIANRGGAAPTALAGAFSTSFSTTALQNAVQTCASVSLTSHSSSSRVVLSATANAAALGTLGARDIQGGYVFWDNGPDGTFGRDDESTGGGGTSPPTTTTEIHDPFGFDADTVSAIGNVILGGVVYDSFGNPLGGGGGGGYSGYGSPSSQDPQVQQDGTLQDPTGLRTDSTGNGVSNPGSGTGVEGNDDLGANAGSMADYLRNAFRQGVANLLASAPFQPGSEGRQFFANAMRMVPFAGAAYSGYAAATGKDPIAGTCEGIGPRVLDGFNAAGGLLEVFHSAAETGGGVPRLSDPLPNGLGSRRLKPIRDAYEEIKLGRGTPRIDPATGAQKIFQANELRQGGGYNRWQGALEWDVPGTSHRILELPDGRFGYVIDHDYLHPRLFPSPWYPDGGK